MKIPRKLGLSFLAINASAAVVMLVFLASILMIARTTERNNHSQDVYAKALTLETAILRQNSQFRGFLVTGDTSYLKSYEEGRTEFDATAVELASMLTVPSEQAQLAEARRETLAWRRNWGDQVLDQPARRDIRRQLLDEILARLADVNRRQHQLRQLHALNGHERGSLSVARPIDGHQTPSLSPSGQWMVPWVHDRHAGAGEILAVAGGDDQIMLERRRRDPGIALGTRVGDVERSASAGDGQVERQEGVGEHRC